MLITRLLALLICVGLCYLLVSQVVVPAFRKEPFFPLFRKKVREKRRELEAAREKRALAEADVEASRLSQETVRFNIDAQTGRVRTIEEARRHLETMPDNIKADEKE